MNESAPSSWGRGRESLIPADLAPSLDELLDCLGVYRAVRDEDQRIIDFDIVHVNGRACETLGVEAKEQTGNRLLEVFPRQRTNGFFDAYLRVVETADLGQIIQSVTRPYVASNSTRLSLHGDPTVLDPPAALTCTLVFHELTTNAVKYGALSSADGQIDVRWRQSTVEPDSPLIIEWTESHGPPVTEPTREGFGSWLIQQAVTYELGGSAQLAFDADGLRCRLEIPCENARVLSVDSQSLA